MTGSFGLALLDLRQQIDAALPGQREIEQHEIEALHLEHAQALFAVGRGLDRIALERKQHFKRLADAGLVVDDEDASRPGEPLTTEDRTG